LQEIKKLEMRKLLLILLQFLVVAAIPTEIERAKIIIPKNVKNK
jgi:hypothetical protein